MLKKLLVVVLWAFVVQGHQFDGIRPQLKSPKYKAQTWPHGIVYYEVNNDLKKNDVAMEGIRKGMDMWSDKTCVKFEKRINEDAYVHFYLGGDCYSEIGRSGYKQFISLAPHCWQAAETAHVIGLALGLYPEQSRYDRDNYVTINWNNIRDDAKRRFIKYPKGVADIENFDYDYQSIMHYKKNAFTKNGLPTIVPATSNVGIGQRNGPSVMDVEKIHFLYHCDSPGGGSGGTVVTTPHPTIPQPITSPPNTSPPTTSLPTTSPPTTSPPTTLPPTTPRPTTSQPTTPRPTTPQPTTPVCVDRWSRLKCMQLWGSGWCYKNPEVMKYYCKKTCNKCASGSGGGGGVGGGDCKDELMYCNTWAKAGWCKSQQSLMERACRKSCNFCSGIGTGTDGTGGIGGTGGATGGAGGGSCKDQLIYCSAWVKHGWCSSKRKYMESYCMKSCNFCGS
ncbi:zinc metalloproteinase nas-14-like [Actinia tenebrosa]|uniref:Metalloendopeptidase n=1 Tax=Actinia tenebrosa TaxID=6105 RepID=A0A6P8IL97_ACTTE|nr:zinc metalloproteinase nas-14-like [Actinia tenebrosa]XP_031567553.1 zinc metalloproteinase nas-14-like [Actinia tenebrosa]